MRRRDRILTNLEGLYRDAYDRADTEGDEAHMQRLDFDFQRDQLYLEVLLDLRELLRTAEPAEEPPPSLIDKAQALRQLTRKLR
jgi:hypothetical protein